tara:strand:- start:120 stop:1343 length:1224 start_codon:yes stop_codon:yes gene_type:complete
MQNINKNSKSSKRMSLLLVPAITIGLSLLGYQTYVWITGETFNGFSFDIGRLWSTDVKSEENLDQIDKDIFNTKIKDEEQQITSLELDKVILPSLKPKKTKVIDKVFEQDLITNTFINKKISSTLYRINYIDVNPLINNDLRIKYIHRLKSESLIFPDMVPKRGKLYWGINFSPAFSYRVFDIDVNKVNGVAEDKNRIYTTGLTEERRNKSDKAITSYSFGVDFGKQISKKFNIYSGVHIAGYGEQILVSTPNEYDPNYCYAEFHNRKPSYEAAELPSAPNNVPYTNQYKYIEIPLGVQYTIYKFDKAKIAIDLGAYYQKVYQVNALLYDFETDYYYWFNERDKIIKDKGIGISSGVSLIQNLTERIELTFNPYLKFNLKSTFSDFYSVQQNQYSTGVRVGVRQQIF